MRPYSQNLRQRIVGTVQRGEGTVEAVHAAFGSALHDVTPENIAG